MQAESLAGFLERLAAGTPAPGGGAVAAHEVAHAAALLAMVARVTARSALPPDDSLAETVQQADTFRQRALTLALEDEQAFSAVAAAAALPRETPAEQQHRRDARSAALVAAAEPQARVVSLAGEVLVRAEALAPVARYSALADLAAAVECLRAAVATASRNVATDVRAAGASARPHHLAAVEGQAAAVIRRATSLVTRLEERLVE